MRLKILSDDEIDALYGRPRFTQEERVEYFTLSAQEKLRSRNCIPSSPRCFSSCNWATSRPAGCCSFLA
jgi:hypothetical protein